jgi:hypothetical protein
MENIL